MSLKYRLIILTVVVFAVSFGLGTLLGVRGARRLAEAQLLDRLAGSAAALAGSGAPLNDDVLRKYAPILNAKIMVLDAAGMATGRQFKRKGGTNATHRSRNCARVQHCPCHRL